MQSFFNAAFRTPTFEFQRISLSDASLSGITLNVHYRLSNPNPIGLSLASVNYGLFIEGKQVVAGTPGQGLSIAANGGSDLVFPAAIKFADIAPVVQTFLSQDTARFKAQGSIGVSTPLGVLTLPLEREGTFEVPKMPKVEFRPPRVSSISLSGATIEFPLAVQNRNSYALPISGIVGALSIAGSNVGTLSTGNLGALDASATKELSMPLTVNFLGAASAVMAAVKGSPANVSFQAQVQSGDAQVPLLVNQLLTFVR